MSRTRKISVGHDLQLSVIEYALMYDLTPAEERTILTIITMCINNKINGFNDIKELEKEILKRENGEELWSKIQSYLSTNA